MPPIRKAFILAAGFGTRLLPLTRIVPKPLLPLNGIPMIERALSMVRSWGVRDVVVNVHHGADALVAHVLQRRHDGLRIAISFEPEILGTGGALTRAAWFFDDGKPFWVVNADVAARVDGQKIVRGFVSGKTIASAWLMATRGPRTVECRNGVITNFETKNRGAEGTYTFCGVHLVNPAVLNYLPKQGFASIIEAYKSAMADGWRVAGIPVERAFWADVGTPEQYVNAESELKQIEKHTSSGRSENAVVIRKGVIVGPGVPMRDYAGIMALPVDALDRDELEAIRKWKHFRPDAIACPLSPRGSARSFTRLYSGRKTAIMICHHSEREENKLYSSHTRFLGLLGIPVPEVLVENAPLGITLYSDVGITSVQDLAPTWSQAKLLALYREVLSTMQSFHEKGGALARRKNIHLMPAFDEALYAWEHNLFADLFLRDHLRVSERQCERIKQELKDISFELIALPPVLVHRDLQSSNIMIKSGRWSLIDYQGMRMGPAVYDLASLLCDPYIKITKTTRDSLLEYYADIAMPESNVREMFWSAAVQRLGQALGAYARLSRIPGTGHFARHIPVATRSLAEALTHVKGLDALKEIIVR
ncbi:MAG TPA: sugar phosphate nucleotidyltransferase [Kiritimatiellia bacterium]|nr:sugar phosphate nucleotidyltransferase [Kiritimatiellia bacterium]